MRHFGSNKQELKLLKSSKKHKFYKCKSLSLRMQNYDLFDKLAKYDVIERFLDTQLLERKIEESAEKKGVWVLAHRDTDVAIDMLRGGLETGIMSYIVQVGDPYVNPPNSKLVSHLSNRSNFSSYLYDTICMDIFIREASISADSENYMNGLLQISELSDFVARTFYGYVQVNHVNKTKRIF